MRLFDNILGFVLLVLAGLLVSIGFAAVFALVFAWIWNGALVPAVTFLRPIGYWQAVGILLAAPLFRTVVTEKGNSD